jgi:Fe-S-cluster containining protein
MESIGTYKICTHCIYTENCCCSFNKINSPVLNEDEIQAIKNYINKNNFYEKKDTNLYNLITKNSKCIFYQNNKCTIYKKRPIDCRLFPLDIIRKDKKYYLIIYLLECIDETKIIEEIKDIDYLIAQVKPWIEIFTKDENYTKMKNLKYKIIKEIVLK